MEELLDQVVGALAQAVWDCVVVLRYSRVGLLQGGRLEGRGADQQGEHATTKRPDVGGETVALLVQHLRRDVVGRPADRPLLLLTKPGGQAKVADLDRHAGGEEEVAELQVPVDDLLLVDVGHALAQLGKVVLVLVLVLVLVFVLALVLVLPEQGSSASQAR